MPRRRAACPARRCCAPLFPLREAARRPIATRSCRIRDDADAVIETERVLFDGRIGTQVVRVWLEYRGGSIVLASHDIGPGLELAFGKDEIETYLEVDAVHLPNLTAALRAEWTDPDAPMDAIQLLAARYHGDLTATTGLRTLLTARGIPHRFTIV